MSNRVTTYFGALAVIALVVGLAPSTSGAQTPQVPAKFYAWQGSDAIGPSTDWFLPSVGGPAATPDQAVAYATRFETEPNRAKRPTSIAQLGDSFASGEGSGGYVPGTSNRIDGLTTNAAGQVGTTSTTAWNACHRSPLASIFTVRGVDRAFDLACSGGDTDDVFSANDQYPGEVPQAYNLARVAATTNLKAVYVAMGANDLGFARMVETCTKNWLTFGPRCQFQFEQQFQTSRVQTLLGAFAVLPNCVVESPRSSWT